MKTFHELFREAKGTLSFACEDEKLRFSMQVQSMLDALNMPRCEFAKRLGKTKAYVSKIMRGDTNFTIETMIAMTRALGGVLHITISHPRIYEQPQTSSGIVVHHIVAERTPTLSFTPPPHMTSSQHHERIH